MGEMLPKTRFRTFFYESFRQEMESPGHNKEITVPCFNKINYISCLKGVFTLRVTIIVQHKEKK